MSLDSTFIALKIAILNSILFHGSWIVFHIDIFKAGNSHLIIIHGLVLVMNWTGLFVFDSGRALKTIGKRRDVGLLLRWVVSIQNISCILNLLFSILFKNLDSITKCDVWNMVIHTCPQK